MANTVNTKSKILKISDKLGKLAKKIDAEKETLAALEKEYEATMKEFESARVAEILEMLNERNMTIDDLKEMLKK